MQNKMAILRLTAASLSALHLLAAVVYFRGTFENSFAALDYLLSPDFARPCYESNCFRVLTPYYASLYVVIGLLSAFAAIPSIIRAREAAICVAMAGLGMGLQAVSRLVLAQETWANQLYIASAARNTTIQQVVICIISLLVATTCDKSDQAVKPLSKAQ
eukprot:g35711.t1